MARSSRISGPSSRATRRTGIFAFPGPKALAAMGLIAYCPLFNIIVRPSSQRIQRNTRNVGNEIQLRPIEIAHSRCTHWLHGSGKAFLRPAQGLVTRIGSEDIPTLLFRVVNRADVADLRAG